jgi:DNA polymerase beta
MEESYNSKFANLLSRLSDAMMRSGEPMKARAYKKGEETILGFTTEIRSIDDIKGKSGIGTAIVNKLQEYIDTGKIRVLDEEENKPERVFTDIYGIGPKKAKELVQQGITSIDELRKQQDKVLNEVQRKGLLYYEDILKRIPREEIDEYGKIFDIAFPREQEAHYEIVGSYRRGLETSGDIDVIVGSPNSSVFDRFLDRLIQENIITAVLSRGKNKCLVVAKIPKSDTYRRVDFLYTIPEEYPFSVLYFTGSKGFNAVMRGHALTRGFSLNEHGFTVMDGKTKGERLSRTFLNEKDIFDFLELEYKEPSERVDGRAVVPIVGKIQDLLVEPVKKEKKRTYKKREPKSKTLKMSPIKEPLEKPIEEPLEEPIEQPIEEPIEQPKEEIQEKPKKKRTYKKREPKLIKLMPNVLEKDTEPKIEIMPSRKKTIKKREPKVDKKSSTSNITNFEEMVSIEKTIVEFKEKGSPVLEALNEQTLNACEDVKKYSGNIMVIKE